MLIVLYLFVNYIAIIVDGELEGCHDNVGKKARMISNVPKIALWEIIMCK